MARLDVNGLRLAVSYQHQVDGRKILSCLKPGYVGRRVKTTVTRCTYLKGSHPELLACHLPEGLEIFDEAVILVDHFHVIRPREVPPRVETFWWVTAISSLVFCNGGE